MKHFYKRFLPLSVCLFLAASCANRFKIKEPLPPTGAVRSPEFAAATGSMIAPGFVGGNKVETLNNGEEIFPAMLSAIRQACSTINFETFVFYDGEVPQEFAAALAERARAGVEVRVILDAVGALKSRPLRKRMEDAGVKLEIFHKVLGLGWGRLNHRTHRKLLIVDGKVGFIGGVGIADEWRGNGLAPDQWHDLHFRVRGPVVTQLQGAFAEHWFENAREVLQGEKFFPSQVAAGNVKARCFLSSSGQNRSEAEWMYHLAIASAQKSLRIENAYFLPDKSLVTALCEAAQRGVKVQIILPGEHIDQKAVRRGSRKRWAKLMKSGVEIYEYQPSMAHTKLVIVDDYFVAVGSTNLDPRSFWINDECNMDILDEGTARQLTKVFQQDLTRSARVTDAGHSVKSIHQAPLSAAQTPVESQL